jgi:hypothetical protein
MSIFSSMLPLLFLMASKSREQQSRPEPGVTTDQSCKVDTLQTISGDCISVITQDAIIQVSLRSLEDYAARSNREWKTEEERVAMIRSDRAKLILNRISEIKDASGCHSVQVGTLDDSVYLISEILEEGSVRIFAHGSTRPEKKVIVRYVGERIDRLAGFGFIHFYLKNESQPFLSVHWWSS